MQPEAELVDVVHELAGEILAVSRERWLLEMNKILVGAVSADGLSAPVLRKTLGALLKNREDVERVLADPSRYRG